MKAEISIDCKNPEMIIKSIEPDIENIERVSASLKSEEGKILLAVESTDITGLLAGINSYLRLIKTADEIDKIGEFAKEET